VAWHPLSEKADFAVGGVEPVKLDYLCWEVFQPPSPLTAPSLSVVADVGDRKLCARERRRYAPACGRHTREHDRWDIAYQGGFS